MHIGLLERELLKLPPHERARLAELLLSSLDEASQSELEHIWFAEARRRCAQIDSGAVLMLASEQVEQEARSLLR
jgi:putative addiction module component (TIGR02574 family)